jgi:hypothetical protein
MLVKSAKMRVRRNFMTERTVVKLGKRVIFMRVMVGPVE